MVQQPARGKHSKLACSCLPDECPQVSIEKESSFREEQLEELLLLQPHFVWLSVFATSLNAEAISANGVL